MKAIERPLGCGAVRRLREASVESNYHSREVGEAPRRVLVVDGPVVPAAPPWALALAGLLLAGGAVAWMVRRGAARAG